MPVVTVFPAGSIGARTPGAHDVETRGLASDARPDRPCQSEGKTAVWQPKRPFQGRAGWSPEVEDEPICQNKIAFFLRNLIPRYVRRVEDSTGP